MHESKIRCKAFATQRQPSCVSCITHSGETQTGTSSKSATQLVCFMYGCCDHHTSADQGRVSVQYAWQDVLNSGKISWIQSCSSWHYNWHLIFTDRCAMSHPLTVSVDCFWVLLLPFCLLPKMPIAQWHFLMHSGQLNQLLAGSL